MGPIPFENRPEEDPGDVVADDCKALVKRTGKQSQVHASPGQTESQVEAS